TGEVIRQSASQLQVFRPCGGLLAGRQEVPLPLSEGGVWMNWTRLGSLALAAAAFLTWPAESQAQIRGWGWRGRPGVYADYGYPYGWPWGYGRGYSPYYYSPWYTWYPSSAYTYTYGNAPSSYSYRAAYPPDSSFGAMPARNDTVLTEV